MIGVDEPPKIRERQFNSYAITLVPNSDYYPGECHVKVSVSYVALRRINFPGLTHL
jgi:hypothetical protein